MKTRKRIKQRSVPRSTVIAGVAVLVMLIMTLSPVFSLNTPKASAQQTCPSGQFWSDSQGKCVPRIRLDVGSLDPTPTPSIPIIPDVIEVEPTVRVEEIETPEPELEETVVIDEDTPILIPTETMEPAAEDDTLIVIFKRACPVGFDPSTASQYDMASTCVDPMDGVTFNVSDGASNIASQAPGDFQPSVAYFQDLPIGPFSIVEIVPAGFGAPVVYCDEYPNGESPSNSSIQQILDGNQIFHLFQQPGQVLNCSWYNIPTGDATPEVDGKSSTSTVAQLATMRHQPTSTTWRLTARNQWMA